MLLANIKKRSPANYVTQCFFYVNLMHLSQNMKGRNMSQIIDLLTQHYSATEAQDSKPNYSSRKFKLPNRESDIAVTDNLWIDNLTGKGGRGPINLVMHLEGFNQTQFPQAKAIVDALSGHIATHTQYTTRPMGSTPANLPADKTPIIEKVEPSLAKWPQVRSYLVEKRKIPEQLVDLAYASGKVFADTRGNVVFAREDDSGYFKRSSVSNFKQTIGQGGKPFYIKGSDGKLFVTEAPIDALTIKALNPSSAVIATGGNATPLENIRSHVDKAKTVYLAFDNDAAGTKFIESMLKTFPNSQFEDHIPPIGNKDWNQYLHTPEASTEKQLKAWKSKGAKVEAVTTSYKDNGVQVEKKSISKGYGFGG